MNGQLSGPRECEKAQETDRQTERDTPSSHAAHGRGGLATSCRQAPSARPTRTALKLNPALVMSWLALAPHERHPNGARMDHVRSHPARLSVLLPSARSRTCPVPRPAVI